MDEKLIKFLKLVPAARWHQVPQVWNDQLCAALADRLVTVGWGGMIKLTDEGVQIAARS